MNSSQLTRRSFLLQSAALALTASASALNSADSALITAPCGRVRGETVGGFMVFRGIPFAQPPVGRLRFRTPERVLPWSGERDATRFAAAAIQPGEAAVQHSEDCLYLNIWAPSERGPHPVLVWIHGGGFTGGRSSDPMFDGARFARDGVICVTIAYRLGAFGFLDLEPALGSSYRGSANNALHDVVAALDWVQHNISAFGGDPHRVTVGGESAGAKLTDMLMGVPSASPLFQQMISESGGAERIWPRPRALEVGEGFLSTWRQTRSGSDSLASASPAEILAAQEKFIREWPVHFPLRAELDGAFIPRLPVESIAKGTCRGKRLLIGTNLDESAMFIGPHPKEDPTARDLGNMTLEQFQIIAARYASTYPDLSREAQRIRSVTAEEYWIPSLRVADAHLRGGGTAFVYRLDFPAQEGRYAGLAFHSYDLGFVWGEKSLKSSTEAADLGAMVHQAWVSFVKGFAPASAGLPPWPPYTLEKRPTMLLNIPPRVADSPAAAEAALWRGVL